jgi:succinyl-diaminopimelate desuccinylase
MSVLDDPISRLGAAMDRAAPEALDFLVGMLRVRAVNPRQGGEGETERADFIQSFLKGEGFEVIREDAPDPAYSRGGRPNLCARLKGRTGRSVLFYVHMDTVPEGNVELWESDPFEPRVDRDRVYARGAEDNGQSLVSCLFALRELKNLGEELPVGVSVWFVSDEEAGSNYGVKHVLKSSPVGPDDLVVVPDAGTPAGDEIQLAEKSLLWLKVVTEGRQVHASRPSKGMNARRLGISLASELDEVLHDRFPARDDLYDEPTSTFEPTKADPGVQNVNTIPGLDAAYFDCRVLPQYTLDSVLDTANSVVRQFAAHSGAGARLEVVQRDDAGPATPEESEVARLTARAVERTTGMPVRFVGTGLRTVGNIFRERGIPTAVWSTIDRVPHEPNEYCRMTSLVSDAKAFASMPFLADPRRAP